MFSVGPSSGQKCDVKPELREQSEHLMLVLGPSRGFACRLSFSLSGHNVSKPDSGPHERPRRERDGDHVS